MDSTIRALRHALTTAPTDFAVATRLASACERAGQVEDAWEALAPFEQQGTGVQRAEVRVALAGIAERNPHWLFDRLLRIDHRSARLLIDLLIECGQANHPALIALASDERVEVLLRHNAQRAVRTTLPIDLREAAEHSPENLRSEISGMLGIGREPPHGFQIPEDVLHARRERWRGSARQKFDRAGKEGIVALLPWLVPFLTAQDPELASQALAVVRRLTDRDGPPFPVEVIARELGRARNESEPS